MITTILPVHNNHGYIRDAVNSILNQTYRDLELIVIDDGSNPEIDLSDIKDDRIRLFRNEEKTGLPNAINVGIKNGKGDYFARQDSDDQSTPTRFEEQIAMFRDDIGLVSTWGSVIDQNGVNIRDGYIKRKIRSINSIEIQKRMLRGPTNYILGPSVMFSRKVFDKIGYFDEYFRMGEDDFNYWVRAMQFFRFDVVEKELYIYRRHRGSMRIVQTHALTCEQRQAIAYQRAFQKPIVKEEL